MVRMALKSIGFAHVPHVNSIIIFFNSLKFIVFSPIVTFVNANLCPDTFVYLKNLFEFLDNNILF